MSDSIREKFEKFQVETGRTDPIWFDHTCFDEASGDYFLNEINADWKQWEAAWKASRESLVIELPAPLQADMNPYGAGYVNGSLKMLSECQEVIEKAGLKVKQ